MADSSEIVVRPTESRDFPAWFALFVAVAEEGRWIGREAPLDEDERRLVFDRTIDAIDALGLVAESGGRLVGQLGLEVRNGTAELGMMVDASARGRGVGTALMAAALEWARGQGAHKVALSLWPHNGAARALYEKFGFVEEGRLRRHWRRANGELWDAVLMGLVLDEDSPGSPFS